MSLTTRSLFTQISCTITCPRFQFQSRKFSILSAPKSWLNPLNFHDKTSRFLNFHEVTAHSHHLPIRVKPLEKDEMVSWRSYGADEFSFDAFLSILEFLALASSAVISVIFAANSALSGSQKQVFGWFGNRFLVWQCVGLVVGVVVGAIIRRRQWRRICSADFSRPVNLVERIEKLEEDLKSSATIVRVLSRQLEKLGIRFRVTRKALKEPIAEKTLDIVVADFNPGHSCCFLNPHQPETLLQHCHFLFGNVLNCLNKLFMGWRGMSIQLVEVCRIPCST